MDGALTGIRVIELGEGISAAFAAKLFADYDAEVIKVELPRSPCASDPTETHDAGNVAQPADVSRLGDVTRSWGPFPGDVPDPEKSGAFFFLNTNKRGLALDFTCDKGRELLLRLIAEADVLIENFSPRQMREWKLDWATLEKINPKLVMISITPFGQTGPYADWKGYDLNAFHLSATGTRYCGVPDQAPLEHGTFSAEFFGAYCAVTWGLAAVIGRDLVAQDDAENEKSGGGQHIDVSCAETVAALFVGAQNIGGYAQDGKSGTRTGVGMPLAAPATIIPCQDGYVWMMALETGQWHGLVRAMGNPDWAQLDLFDDMFERAQNSDMIYAFLYEWAAAHTKQEIMDLCQANGCPTTAVFTVAEAGEHPHLRERNYLREIAHAALGTVRTFGAPVHLTACPGGATAPAPLFGEHNAEILGVRLGLSVAEQSTLRSVGVIA